MNNIIDKKLNDLINKLRKNNYKLYLQIKDNKDNLINLLNQYTKKTEKDINNLLENVKEISFLYTLYSIAIKTGYINLNVDYTIPEDKDKMWCSDGKNVNDRFYEHKKELINNAKNNNNDILLLKAIKKYNNSIESIAITETTRLETTYTKYASNKEGINKYQFLATLDNRTSQICQKLDLKIFNYNELVIGINCPPMHPRCRSTIAPYTDDITLSERSANVDNNTYWTKVDKDMTYNEYKKRYIK